MKALVIAAVLAASTSLAAAGAARDARPLDAVDKSTATVIADAGRIGTTGLASLNGNPGPWAPTPRETDTGFGEIAAPLDSSVLLLALGAVAIAVGRPLGRALRRQEQQRRATALASTLGHTPRT